MNFDVALKMFQGSIVLEIKGAVSFWKGWMGWMLDGPKCCVYNWLLLAPNLSSEGRWAVKAIL